MLAVTLRGHGFFLSPFAWRQEKICRDSVLFRIQVPVAPPSRIQRVVIAALEYPALFHYQDLVRAAYGR
jgi:hypothetical protein